jgi:hypothetical protein
MKWQISEVQAMTYGDGFAVQEENGNSLLCLTYDSVDNAQKAREAMHLVLATAVVVVSYAR